jgi:phosphohistidine phosphatase
MKSLVLMRHAKSSWDHPNLSDLERPLNARGERDAPLMGAHFSEWGILPDLLISSPAVRAQETARRVAQAIDYPESRIGQDVRLYEQGFQGILSVIQGLPDVTETVCLFGHNPDFSVAAGLLGGEDITHLPTASLVLLRFAVKDWAAVMPGSGRIHRFEYPKRLLN